MLIPADPDPEPTARPNRIMMNRPSLTELDRNAADKVLRSGWIGSGPETAAFESELAAFLKVDHVVCTSSCTAALELVMHQLGIGPGDRVVIPTWTYPGTALPAAHRGATIVLADVDPVDLNLDPDSLERTLERGAALVIPVHVAGNPADRRIWDLCAEAGVPILDDAAHAFGAKTLNGMVRGDGSVAAAFSFHATKNLTCVEGGAIATDDPDLAASLRVSRSHGLLVDAWDRERDGIWPQGDIVDPGFKANLPDVLAAIGRSQLRSFERRQSHRRTLVMRYRANLADDPRVRPVPTDLREGSADHMMIVELPAGGRDRAISSLSAAGIATGLHYTPLHRLTWFAANAEVAPGGLPNAERMQHRVLTLPLHPGLTTADVDDVCSVLAASLDASTD